MKIKLKKLAQENEKLQEKLAKSYSQKLVNLLPTIKEFIRNNKLPDGTLANIALNSQIISSLLVRAGLPLWANFNDELLAMGQLAIQNLASQGLHTDLLSGSAGTILNALQTDISDILDPVKDDMATQMTRLSDNLIVEVKGVLERMQVAPVGIGIASADLATRFDIAASQAKTILNTGLAAIQREANIKVGSKLESVGVDVFYVYQGPSDKVTRDFCKKIVGKALTREQIALLKNSNGSNVFKYGGGYNCRHNWFAMSKSAIEASGIEFLG